MLGAEVLVASSPDQWCSTEGNLETLFEEERLRQHPVKPT